MRRLLIILVAFASLGQLYAQMLVGECGTHLSQSDTTWLYQLPWFGNNSYLVDLLRELEQSQKNQTIQAAACGGTTSATFRVPIQAVLVRRTDSTGITHDFIPDLVISQVNSIYYTNNIGIQFYLLCPNRYLYDDEYYGELSGYDSHTPLFSTIDTDGAIDVFFLGTMDALINGAARFPSRVHPFHALVRCDRPQVEDIAETLAHELAHCLNVLHTADGTRDDQDDNANCSRCKQESVLHSRTQGILCDFAGQLKCEVNGDFLCDTEADAGSYSGDSANVLNVVNCNLVDIPNSAYSNYNEDKWGDKWNPDLTNLMSYAHGCRSTFTPMQRAVMVNSVISYIPNFSPRVENDFDVFEPNNFPQSATRLQLGDVQCHTFHWAPLSSNEFSACDEDWFRVTLPTYGALEIKTFDVAGQPQPDTYLELFDSTLSPIASNDSLLPGSQFAWIPDINLLPGTYLVRASHRSLQGTTESRGHYHIQANFGPPVQTPEAASADLFASMTLDDQNRQVHVHAGRPGHYALQVSDFQGKIIFVNGFNAYAGAQYRFDIPASPSGMLLATLRQGDAVLRKRFPVLNR